MATTVVGTAGSDSNPGPDNAGFWDWACREMIRRGDYRDRPEDYVPVAQRCLGPVVEVGPAFGEFSRYLKPTVGYVGLEIGHAFCTEARRRYRERVFVEVDVIEFAGQFPGVFRTAVAMQVLEHYARPRQMLDALERLATERIIVTVPRGPVSKAVREADGHKMEWMNDGELKMTLEPYGKVEVFAGAENHVCAMVTKQRAE